MKLLNSKSKVWLLGFLTFCIAFAAVYITMPKNEFRYNTDVSISAVGMAISKTHLDTPSDTPSWFRGYVQDGELTPYTNWPPLGFKALTLWFKLTGRQDIFSGRLFSAWLYGINALLFFIFLLSKQVNKRVAFIASFCFIVLPHHLYYSSLIYVDHWFITFWLLALLCYNHQHIRKYWLFALITLLSFRFFLFGIFLLPLPVLMHLHRKYQPGKKMVILFFSLIALLIWGTQYYLTYTSVDNHAINKMRHFSIYGFLSNIHKYYAFMIKRVVSLGYEAFLLVPLIVYQGGLYIKARYYKSFQGLYQAILVVGIALVFYFLSFPNWFAIHSHGIGMFSILIGGIVALKLSVLQESNKKFIRASTLAAITSVILFICLPLISRTHEARKIQDKQISSFINVKRKNPDRKTCLFLDISESHQKQHGMAKFGIREYTNSYIFNLTKWGEIKSNNEKVKSGIEKLIKNDILDFDSGAIFLITDKKYLKEQLTILDSTEVNSLKVYHISIKDY